MRTALALAFVLAAAPAAAAEIGFQQSFDVAPVPLPVNFTFGVSRDGTDVTYEWPTITSHSFDIAAVEITADNAAGLGFDWPALEALFPQDDSASAEVWFSADVPITFHTVTWEPGLRFVHGSGAGFAFEPTRLTLRLSVPPEDLFVAIALEGTNGERPVPEPAAVVLLVLGACHVSRRFPAPARRCHRY